MFLGCHCKGLRCGHSAKCAGPIELEHELGGTTVGIPTQNLCNGRLAPDPVISGHCTGQSRICSMATTSSESIRIAFFGSWYLAYGRIITLASGP